MNNNRKPRINAHCHLFNYDFVPDDISKLLSKFPEKLTQKWIIKDGLPFIAKIWPGKSLNRLKSFFKTYSSKIEKVSSDYANELSDANIDIYTPLLMNLEEASTNEGKNQIKYQEQINLISKEVAKYYWRIFPFVMFDPRSATAFNDCKTAIEEKGYIGVKMYPALGYHPDPDIVGEIGIYGFENSTHKPDKLAAEQLRKLYSYCNKNKIPITTHVTPGGSYSTKMHKNREKYAWPLTEISNWNNVLAKYENLKINFAHFGGNSFSKKKDQRILSRTWQRQILNLMFMYNKIDVSRIFTDLSFHDMAFKKTKKRYFELLKQLLSHDKYKLYILFGTDASMISHTYSEKEYVDGFKKELTQIEEELIFSDNPTRFLFNNKKIPDNYINFLKREAPEALNSIPDFIIENDSNYYVV